jgi:hypothetical protein
MNKEY